MKSHILWMRASIWIKNDVLNLQMEGTLIVKHSFTFHLQMSLQAKHRILRKQKRETSVDGFLLNNKQLIRCAFIYTLNKQSEKSIIFTHMNNVSLLLFVAYQYVFFRVNQLSVWKFVYMRVRTNKNVCQTFSVWKILHAFQCLEKSFMPSSCYLMDMEKIFDYVKNDVLSLSVIYLVCLFEVMDRTTQQTFLICQSVLVQLPHHLRAKHCK